MHFVEEEFGGSVGVGAPEEFLSEQGVGLHLAENSGTK